jgi:hypothetical protein
MVGRCGSSTTGHQGRIGSKSRNNSAGTGTPLIIRNARLRGGQSALVCHMMLPPSRPALSRRRPLLFFADAPAVVFPDSFGDPLWDLAAEYRQAGARFVRADVAFGESA